MALGAALGGRVGCAVGGPTPSCLSSLFSFFFFFFPPAVELDLARDLARPLQGRRYRVVDPVQGSRLLWGSLPTLECVRGPGGAACAGLFGREELDPGWWASGLYGRESIFLFSHTNEFCGK